jgi:hypothetical protein
MRKILAVGTPRGGTFYVSKFLTSCGLLVGHEKINRDGVSDWSMLPFLLGGELPSDVIKAYDNELNHNKNYRHDKYEHLIHIIREPWSCISTMCNVYPEEIKYQNVNCICGQLNPEKYIDVKSYVDRNAITYLTWHQMIKDLNPDFTFKIENGQKDMVNLLFDNKLINHKPKITEGMRKKQVRHHAPTTHRLSIDKMKKQMKDDTIEKILKFKDEI